MCPAHLEEAQQEFESKEADLELTAEKKVFVFNSPLYRNPLYHCLVTLEIEIDPRVSTVIPDVTYLFMWIL